MKNYLKMLLVSGIIVLSGGSCGNGIENGNDTTGPTTTASAPPSASVDSVVTNRAAETGSLKSIMDSNVVRMSRIELSNHPTKDFALMMRVHHAGARQLIAAARKEKLDTGLAKIVVDLDKSLRDEVVMLNRFIIDRRYKRKAPESAVSNNLMKAMTPNTQPSMPMTGNASEDFARLMITSLQSANDMVEEMENADAGYDISGFSEQMVSRNERYIAALKDWSTRK